MSRGDAGWLLGVCVVVVACSGTAEQQQRNDHPPAVAVDSLTISAADLTNAPALPLRETLRLGEGGSGKGYAFSYIAGVGVTARGTIAVLDSRNNRVVVFDKAGKQLRTFGQSGKGPGDLSRPRALTIAGDTIVVLDFHLLHEFSLEGEVLRATPPEQAGASGGRRAVEAFAAVPRGILVAQALPTVAAPDTRTPQADSTEFQFRPDETRAFARQFVLPALRWFPKYKPRKNLPDGSSIREGVRRYMQAFSASPHYAIAPDGHVLFTTGERYAVDILGLDGRPVRRIVGALAPVPIPAGDFDRVFAHSRASVDSQVRFDAQTMGAQTREERLDGIKFAEKLPRVKSRAVVGRLMASDDGTILIERLDLGPIDRASWFSDAMAFQFGPTTWDVVNLSTGLLGRFTMPNHFRPFAFRDGKLYGVDQNEAGVQTVVRYDLLLR